MQRIRKIDCSISLASVLSGFPPEWENAPQKNTIPIGLPAGEYSVEYDYPMTTSLRVSYHLTPDTTPDDILKLVAKEYQRIYAEEEASTKVTPGTHSVLQGNRNKTDGKYGIYGHVMGDLFVDGLTIDIENKNIDLCMGS